LAHECTGLHHRISLHIRDLRCACNLHVSYYPLPPNSYPSTLTSRRHPSCYSTSFLLFLSLPDSVSGGRP
jgi:hypothetical protein